MRRVLVKNALANLARGSAAALVALFLPPMLIRHMHPASYAVWVLALQAAAYVAYLDFGLHTAVGRYIAFANEKRDAALRDGIFSAALVGLAIAGSLGFLLVDGIATVAYRVFPSVPPDLLIPFRITMLIAGGGTALALPGSAWSGIFVGLQRYEVPAVAASTGKFLLAAGLIWCAITGKSLVMMAIIMAVTNLYTYGLQFMLQRRIAPEIHFNRALITRPIIKELTGYCLSLSIWSLSMLLVNGFDLILVGHFQFSAVVPYSAASTLIMFLAGVQMAIFSVIMPHAAELHAHKSSAALGELLVNSTRLGVLLLLMTGLPLVVFASVIIKIWIGPQFSLAGGKILSILVVANMIRLTGTPYASILTGTGQQKQILVGPLAEGFMNLFASIMLGLRFGAGGVAWGTLVGAVVGVAANVIYSIPRTEEHIRLSQTRYLGAGIAMPGLCAVPVIVLVFSPSMAPTASMSTSIIAVTCSTIAAISLLLWSIRKKGLSDANTLEVAKTSSCTL